MKPIILWLSNYGGEYDVVNKKLYIRKPMQVGDFVELKKIVKELGVVDIILESEGKIYGKKIWVY